MKYAEVAVNAPTAWPRTFTYTLPPDPQIAVGCAVWVPFGPRTLQGIVFNLTDHSPVEETKEIAEVIEPQPLLSEHQVELARWIAEYYLSPYFEAASLMLPPGFERRTLIFIEPVSDSPAEATAKLTPIQKKVFNFLKKSGSIDARQLKKKMPEKQISPTIKQLVAKGLIKKTTALQHERIKPKEILHIRLAVDRHEAESQIVILEKKRALRQSDLLRLLIEEVDDLPLSEAVKQTGAAQNVARSLQKKGLVTIEKIEVRRDPLAHRSFPSVSPPELTPDQKTAWVQIQEKLRGLSAKREPSVFLLHGITGSGKTEIYLRALKETIAQGKKAIVLVPEIALTPQTIARFASRFPDRVAVLHSKLSPGEQFDEWHRIREGEFDVVIGSRSAIFAPQPDLGLIVIDEEHEWTYKQHDKIPLYHARKAALKLAELTGSVVILGSATPDIESYHHAQKGDYQLLELPERVGETNNGMFPVLPQVVLVDLRQELKQGNRSIFSRKLAQAIDEALAAREQVILFLNRRGAASFVQCRDCGHVMSCRRCEMALTHHYEENELICHLCNYRIPTPTSCPKCWSRRIKFLGIGTQKVEEETARAFPQARILRWDRDVTKGKYSHEKILHTFQSHEADILIGTQMIAKGLDIPLVTLVGVINADIGLYLPDFRAGERTFQLLSQVSGRAGRGQRGGQAIIQTYTPEHYAIIAAAQQDFGSFYTQESDLRHQYSYPPFNRLASLIYIHTNAERCQEEAERMADAIREEQGSQGLANMAIIGPSPAYTQRVRGRYRWQVVLRSPDPISILSKVSIPQGWTVDIDPVGLT
ncbi:MAG: primosomal protein N' [Chloroflexi bacterium]|nr:primosomal protein N' [Chloroflexota bacterium]